MSASKGTKHKNITKRPKFALFKDSLLIDKDLKIKYHNIKGLSS